MKFRRNKRNQVRHAKMMLLQDKKWGSYGLPERSEGKSGLESAGMKLLRGLKETVQQHPGATVGAVLVGGVLLGKMKTLRKAVFSGVRMVGGIALSKVLYKIV